MATCKPGSSGSCVGTSKCCRRHAAAIVMHNAVLLQLCCSPMVLQKPRLACCLLQGRQSARRRSKRNSALTRIPASPWLAGLGAWTSRRALTWCCRRCQRWPIKVVRWAVATLPGGNPLTGSLPQKHLVDHHSAEECCDDPDTRLCHSKGVTLLLAATWTPARLEDLPTPGLRKVSKLARPLSPAWLLLDEAQSLPHNQAQADISAEACQDSHCLPGLVFQQSGSSLHIVNNLCCVQEVVFKPSGAR